MPIRLLLGDMPLPPAETADARGLVAVGGDLRPERLLDGYRRGIFPWYEEGLPILWHSPDPRFVLPVDELVVQRSLRRALRKSPYRLTLDEAFGEVVRACAVTRRPGQHGTWITDDMQAAYDALHRLGHAHSCEAWLGDRLVGGLYGVAVGRVFCGESMFATHSDASKIAFVWTVEQLRRWRFELIDCQVRTEHLERFGARDWPRSRFLAELARLSRGGPAPGRWAFDDAAREAMRLTAERDGEQAS